jgi:DNA modification methylase
VLCELAYTWFSKAGSQVVDCFAGGSVRGVVAGSLDRKYYGIDLREEQIKANVQQAKDLIPNADVQYVCGDSNALIKNAPDADFIFSCPPYGDLEVYSDKEDDLSNMPDDEFDKVYANIIKQTCDRLKDDRFACFVVGDYRDKDGNYTNFTGKTVQAFLDAGLKLYNEAILATPIGTAMLRAGKQFDAKRKLVKTHQNVYVFLKGDARKASNYVMDK